MTHRNRPELLHRPHLRRLLELLAEDVPAEEFEVVAAAARQRRTGRGGRRGGLGHRPRCGSRTCVSTGAAKPS